MKKIAAEEGIRMKKLVAILGSVALVGGLGTAGIAAADEPMTLTGTQMDGVTAGAVLIGGLCASVDALAAPITASVAIGPDGKHIDARPTDYLSNKVGILLAS